MSAARLLLTLSTAVVEDHLSRLYSGDVHVDLPGAEMRIVRPGARCSKVEMTGPAAADLADDCEYQAECLRSETAWSAARPYSRVAAQVRSVLTP